MPLKLTKYYFIHFKDDVITGFIVFLGFSSVHCSTYYILDDVYLTPAYRRQGIAKQLIDTAIHFLHNEKALLIHLETQKIIWNLINYMNK